MLVFLSSSSATVWLTYAVESGIHWRVVYISECTSEKLFYFLLSSHSRYPSALPIALNLWHRKKKHQKKKFWWTFLTQSSAVLSLRRRLSLTTVSTEYSVEIFKLYILISISSHSLTRWYQSRKIPCIASMHVYLRCASVSVDKSDSSYLETFK